MFGYLTIISRCGKIHGKRAAWLVKCKCGNKKIISGKDLRNGHVKSCGCMKLEKIKKRSKEKVSNTIKKAINKTFGRLTPIKYVGSNDSGRSLFKCKCECGKEIIIEFKRLVSGHTTSCGCYRTDAIRMWNQQPEIIAKHKMGIQMMIEDKKRIIDQF